MAVIHAMWLRQMKRYFRSCPRIVAAFGQPMLFLLPLGYGFGPVFRQAGHGKISACTSNLASGPMNVFAL